MPSADESHRARGKRGLIVAKKGASSRQRNRKFVRGSENSEISGQHGRRGGWLVNTEDISQAVDHGDHDCIGLGGGGRGLHQHLHVNWTQLLRGGRGLGWRGSNWGRTGATAPTAADPGARREDESEPDNPANQQTRLPCVFKR